MERYESKWSFYDLYKMGLIETLCFIKFNSEWYSGKVLTWYEE